MLEARTCCVLLLGIFLYIFMHLMMSCLMCALCKFVFCSFVFFSWFLLMFGVCLFLGARYIDLSTNYIQMSTLLLLGFVPSLFCYLAFVC
jgi:hypothetical protein